MSKIIVTLGSSASSLGSLIIVGMVFYLVAVVRLRRCRQAEEKSFEAAVLWRDEWRTFLHGAGLWFVFLLMITGSAMSTASINCFEAAMTSDTVSPELLAAIKAESTLPIRVGAVLGVLAAILVGSLFRVLGPRYMENTE
ncbi:hypothetical protein H8E07_07015 [bacterium]|nr:hypothetical protein [bacterium]